MENSFYRRNDGMDGFSIAPVLDRSLRLSSIRAKTSDE